MTRKLKSLTLSAGAILYAALLLLALYANYQAPRLDFGFEWGDETWRVTQAKAPLQRGDVLKEIAGIEAIHLSLLTDSSYLTSSGEFWEWLELKGRVYEALTGPTVNLLLERKGDFVSVETPVVQGDWSFLKNPAITHFFVSCIFLLVGWATYARPGAGKQALWFYLLCLSMSLVYLSNVASLLCHPVLHPTVFRSINILNLVNFLLAPALLFHFALLLPRDRTKPWLLLVIYGAALYALLTFDLSLISVLVPIYFLGSLLAIAQGAWSYRGLVERQQMKWVGVGFLLGVGPWFLLNGLPLLVSGQRLMSDTLPGACLVFIPIFMAVAIQRYRLFDIGSFLQGTFTYLATLLILLGIDVTVLSFLGFGEEIGQAHLLSLVLLLALYAPLRSRLTSAVGRLSHRRLPSTKEAVETLNQELSAAGPGEILQGLQLTIHALFAPESFESVAPEGRSPGAYLEWLEQPCVVVVLSQDLALRCGPLPKGRFYTSEVLETLGHLAEHGALHLRAELLYRQAAEEKSRRLEERERLLGDLHDGVGSALANIRLLSKEDKISRLAADALFELQNFLYTGPEYTMTREQFLVDLKTYGQNLFQDHSVEFRLEVEGETQKPMSREQALCLFRMLKEAMTNSLKHAQGSFCKIFLDFGQENSKSLGVLVSDDGRGGLDESSGRGLSGMKNRVEQLGGSFEMEKQSGFKLRLSLPL